MKYLINLLFLLGAAFFLGGCSDDDDPVDTPRLEVSESSLRFGSLATEQVIQVTSSEAWKIANIPDWLSVEPVSGQAGEYEVKVAVIENTTEVERKVRLVVQAGTENWNLPVYQLEKGVLEINEKEFIALYNHTSLKVPYRSNGTLNVTFSEGVDWITAPVTKAVTDRNLALTLTVNNSNVIREAIVYLKDTQSNLSDTLKVTQYPEPKWKLNNDKLFAKYDMTELTHSFECNIPFDVVFDEEVEWVKLKETKSEDGQFKMVFELQPNTGEFFNRTKLRLENEVLGLSFPLSLSQMYKTYDGHTVIWKKPTYNDPFASVPNFPRITFNFILIGDGFTKEEIESGVYDLYCQEDAGVMDCI